MGDTDESSQTGFLGPRPLSDLSLVWGDHWSSEPPFLPTGKSAAQKEAGPSAGHPSPDILGVSPLGVDQGPKHLLPSHLSQVWPLDLRQKEMLQAKDPVWSRPSESCPGSLSGLERAGLALPKLSWQAAHPASQPTMSLQQLCGLK